MDSCYRISDEIVAAIRQADSVIAPDTDNNGRVSVVLFGGRAIKIISSHPVQSLDEEMSKQGLLVVSDAASCLHPDYQKRLIPYMSLSHIDLFVLNPLDWAIAKTGMGTSKDFYDLYVSNIFTMFDVDEFITTYRDAMTYWRAADRNIITHNLWGGNGGKYEANLQRAVGIGIERGLISHKGLAKDLKAAVKTIRAGSLRDSMAINALQFMVTDDMLEREKLANSPGVVDAALFLLQNVGESVTDSFEEKALAAFLTRKLLTAMGALSFEALVEEWKLKNGPHTLNAADIFKTFKTLLQLIGKEKLNIEGYFQKREYEKKETDWERKVSAFLTGYNTPRILTTPVLNRLASSYRENGMTDRVLYRWIKSMCERKRLAKIQRGLYANMKAYPTVYADEAAAYIRPGAVISLHSVLGDIGFLNNPSRIVFAVIPIRENSSGYKTICNSGTVRTPFGEYSFHGLPMRLMDHRAGPLEDRENQEIMYRRAATPEKALLDWLYLGHSKHTRFTMPPLDVDFENLDEERLMQLANYMGLTDVLKEYRARVDLYYQDDNVQHNGPKLY